MSYRVEKWQNENAPDAAELRKIMTAEGYSVFEWADPPDAVYSDHQHGEDQSHWVVSGILELTVAGSWACYFGARRQGFYAGRHGSFGVRSWRRARFVFDREKIIKFLR